MDGAIAVGKIGTREQAHHQGHSPAVNQQVDLSERVVRTLQRGLKSFTDAKTSNDANPVPADIITGFLLRSSAVSGWPHMDVRAYKTDIPEPFLPSDANPLSQQLPTLRLELLSPGLMIALFQGVPQLVTLEEPHHGVQFGVHLDNSTYKVYVRDSTGHQIPTGAASKYFEVELPVRATNSRVVHVTELRRRINALRTNVPATVPSAIPITGSASLAIAVLDPPWRQRFEGTVDNAGTQATSGGFVANLQLAQRVSETVTFDEVRNLVSIHGN